MPIARGEQRLGPFSVDKGHAQDGIFRSLLGQDPLLGVGVDVAASVQCGAAQDAAPATREDAGEPKVRKVPSDEMVGMPSGVAAATKTSQAELMMARISSSGLKRLA